LVALRRVVSVVRLRAVRLRVVVSAVLRRVVVLVVLRRTKVVSVVVVFRNSNNNSRWEWEELQCKVVREWVREECRRRRAVCSRMVVRAVVR